jgi:hypothetical protein
VVGEHSAIFKNENKLAWWLTPVILATWKVDIGRVTVQGQSEQKVQETPSPPL